MKISTLFQHFPEIREEFIRRATPDYPSSMLVHWLRRLPVVVEEKIYIPDDISKYRRTYGCPAHCGGVRPQGKPVYAARMGRRPESAGR